MIAKVLVKKLSPKAFLPIYSKPGDAGCDVCANLDYELHVKSGERVLVPTGLAFAIQEGFECQVRSRSGLALKNGIVVLNSPGTIDSGYRGELGVILFNTSSETFKVKHGDRIAQLVFAPVTQASFQLTDELDETARGQGGFGSTGV